MQYLSLSYIDSPENNFEVYSCKQIQLASYLYSHYAFELFVSIEHDFDPKRLLQLKIFSEKQEINFLVMINNITVNYKLNTPQITLQLCSVLQFFHNQLYSQVYSNKSVLDICISLFKDFNLPTPNIQLENSVTKSLYEVQYQESTLLFLYRMLYKHSLWLFPKKNKLGFIITSKTSKNLLNNGVTQLNLDSTTFTNDFVYIRFNNKKNIYVDFTSMKLFKQFECLEIESTLSLPYKKWLVISTQYNINQMSELSAKRLALHHYKLIPIENFTIEAPPSPRAIITSATVIANEKNLQSSLDEYGFYTVQYHFNINCITPVIKVPKLESYGGIYNNMHFPLLPDTQVIIGFLHDDIDVPFILAGFYNNILLIPQIEKNIATNLWRSHLGATIEMNDKKKYLALSSHASKNNIILNATEKKLIGDSAEKISFHATNNYTIYAKQKLIMQAQQDSAFYAQQDLIIHSKIIQLTTTSLTIKGRTFNIRSEQLNITSELYQTHCKLFMKQAKNNISINANNLNIKALQLLKINSKNKITFKVGNSSIIIGNGEIAFSARKIQMRNVLNKAPLMPYKM